MPQAARLVDMIMMRSWPRRNIRLLGYLSCSALSLCLCLRFCPLSQSLSVSPQSLSLPLSLSLSPLVSVICICLCTCLCMSLCLGLAAGLDHMSFLHGLAGCTLAGGSVLAVLGNSGEVPPGSKVLRAAPPTLCVGISRFSPHHFLQDDIL